MTIYLPLQHPEGVIHPILTVLFEDTVSARMLRALARAGSMTQAEFMREYHRRCERAKPSRSSFGNNFGRYACYERSPASRVDNTAFVIARGTVPGHPSRGLLRWRAPAPLVLVQNLPDAWLERFFVRMERAMQGEGDIKAGTMRSLRASDAPEDFTPWVDLMVAERARRSAGGKAISLDAKLDDDPAVARTAPADHPDLHLDGPFVVAYDGHYSHIVQGIVEASLQWCRERDARGFGARDAASVVVTHAASGRTWRISYNGKVWAMRGGTVGNMRDELIYCPSRDLADAADEARWESRAS